MGWRHRFFNHLVFLELFAGSFGQELVRESKDTGRAYTGHLWTLQGDAASYIYSMIFWSTGLAAYTANDGNR